MLKGNVVLIKHYNSNYQLSGLFLAHTHTHTLMGAGMHTHASSSFVQIGDTRPASVNNVYWLT